MPQLNFSVYLPQIVWFVGIFGCFFALVKYAILPNLFLIKTSRDDLINGYIQQAEQNNSKIKALEAKIAAINIATNEQIQQIIAEAEKKAKHKFDEAIKQIDEEYRRELKQIASTGDAEQAKTIEALNPLIDKITAQILEKLK